MSEPPTPIWMAVELDPGVAQFFELPEKLYLPARSDSPLPDEPGFSVARLGEALEESARSHPDMAARAEILGFIARWRGLADLERYLAVGNETFSRRIVTDLLRSDRDSPPAHYALGRFALSGARWTEALEHLGRVLERAPSHGESRFLHALARAGSGDPGGAAVELKPLTHDPRFEHVARLWRYELKRAPADRLSGQIAEWLARPFASSPSPAETAARWDELARSFPDNPEALYLGARRSTSTDTERRSLLERVLQCDPGHVPALVLLAAIRRRAGDPAGASGLLEAGVQRVESPSLWAHLGLAREQEGRSEPARTAYRTALESPLSKLDVDTLATASTGLARVGGSEETRLVLDDAISARPGDPIPHQLLARLEEEAGEEDLAERRLRNAVRECGPRPALNYALGGFLRRQGRRTEAEGLFKMLVKRHERSPWGHRGLGDLALPENPSVALEHYARAIELDPRTPIPGYDYLRGMMALRNGDGAQAASLLAQAVAGEPGNARTWCDLGAAFFFAGRLDRALAATERALSLQPDHPGYLHNLAQLHRARFQEAPLRHLGSLFRSWRYRWRRRRREEVEPRWSRDLWSGKTERGEDAG